MKLKKTFCAIICIIANVTIGFAQTPAFPTAEGYGKWSKGGRGGNVYFVSNLNDSGSGSLREACEASGPRTVIFRVGGTIDLKSPININKSGITIAGETAPGDGIALRNNFAYAGGLIDFSKSVSDVIIRHIRFRPGPGISDGDGDYTPGNGHDSTGFSIWSGSNIIIDHCSISWSTNENVQIWNNRYGRKIENITIQNSMISEPIGGTLDRHGELAYDWGESHGLLTGNSWESGAVETPINNITLYNNLFALNGWRNPYLKAHGPQTSHYQFTNNVVYGWDYYGATIIGSDVSDGSVTKVIAENNFYKTGLETELDKKEFNVEKGVKIWAKGNIGPSRPSDNLDQWALFSDMKDADKLSSKFNAPNIPVISADQAYNQVLNNVGATLPVRDNVDKRVVGYVRDGNGKAIRYGTDSRLNWPFLAKGTPYIDTDNDGMKDQWEIDNFGSINNYDHNDYAPSGYTYLEEFLHCQAGDSEDCSINNNFNIQDYTPPTSVIPGESYTINIPYTGNGQSDIHISLQNKDENWKTEGSAQATVSGSGTATLEVTVNANATLGNNYHWQAYITPVGGAFSNRYDNKLVDDVSCVNSVNFSIQNYNPPTNVIPGESYTINILYTGTGASDINISLQNKDENWKTEGSAQATVSGSGTATLEVTVNANATLGNNYHWQAYITPVGGAFSNRYDNKLVDGVSCNQANRTSEISEVVDKGISFYPNPAKDGLILRVDSSLKEIRSIRIYDLQGRVAKEISKDELKENIEQTIDISSITDGMYILSIDFIKKEAQNTRFIIKH
ncbi:T9SS type A sorting domain-containing protein [uncultured Aquimarina sp.]|uniref:T9SS type A sorting domain-containing protein n=1 Tax=uncultured Aquimarina sp. TaxID=575652 RepID=UPI00260AD316|nr:T9SS type A sorting domain-containing protein [uncultured Aquimarina sp.]